MRKLFGTDGIRGLANRYPLIPESALQVGRAAAAYFGKEGKRKIIIGKDTRISCSMLEQAIGAGVCSMGLDVFKAGFIPVLQLNLLPPGVYNASACGYLCVL